MLPASASTSRLTEIIMRPVLLLSILMFNNVKLSENIFYLFNCLYLYVSVNVLNSDVLLFLHYFDDSIIRLFGQM